MTPAPSHQKIYGIGLASILIGARIPQEIGRVIGRQLKDLDNILPWVRLTQLFSHFSSELRELILALCVIALVSILIYYLSKIVLCSSSKWKKISVVAVSIGALLSSGIAMGFTILKSKYISDNPLLRRVRESGTDVVITNFKCAGNMGSYDVAKDRLSICASNHDLSDLNSTYESTVRHEVWHIVQTCNVYIATGEWSGLAALEPEGLDSIVLDRETEDRYNELYGENPVSLQYELEAAKAERLSDFVVLDFFNTYCLPSKKIS